MVVGKKNHKEKEKESDNADLLGLVHLPSALVPAVRRQARRRRRRKADYTAPATICGSQARFEIT